MDKVKFRSPGAYLYLLKTEHNQYETSRDSALTWYKMILDRYPNDKNLHEMVEKLAFNVFQLGILTTKHKDYRDDFIKQLKK